jgi:hypothetical protein
MAIADWFKRFKRNASALEEYREGDGDTQSQAERAAHEGVRAPQQSAAAPDKPRTDDE